MKLIKKLYCLVLIISIFSCDNDDGFVAQCAAIDYAVPSLLIELQDTSGANLLENGTYNPDEVNVTVTETNVSRIAETENGRVIEILLSNTVNSRDATVVLNDTETDILRLDLNSSSTGFPCFFPIFNVEEALYNGTVQTIEQLEFNQKITVIK